ncbi:MAG: hypothetical protein RXP27_03670 [Nitrososphaeria archaeon]
MSTNPLQIRRRTPLPVMAYAVYLYFSGPSLRRAARALRPIMSRSHVSIWGVGAGARPHPRIHRRGS